MLTVEGVNGVSTVCEQGVNSFNSTGCQHRVNRVLTWC